MKILVIGSEGTLGKPLCHEMERRGYKVYRADLAHKKYPDYVRCDISEYRQCERLFNTKFDYVYLLAAEFGRINGEEYYEHVWKTNVIGTRNILELQKIHKFKLVFTSSSEVYGELDNPLLSERLSDEVPLRQHNDYAISKWVNELQCMNAEDQYDNDIVRIRLFNAYGPGEEYTRYRSVVCLFCYSALNRIPYQVYQNYYRVFMYIDDLIPTLVNVVDNYKAGSVYNIGGNEYCSVAQLNDVILDSISASEREAVQIEYLDEDKHNVKSKRPDITLAQADLGHNPKIKIYEGVPQTIEWMRKHYNIGLLRKIA